MTKREFFSIVISGSVMVGFGFIDVATTLMPISVSAALIASSRLRRVHLATDFAEVGGVGVVMGHDMAGRHHVLGIRIVAIVVIFVDTTKEIVVVVMVEHWEGVIVEVLEVMVVVAVVLFFIATREVGFFTSCVDIVNSVPVQV